MTDTGSSVGNLDNFASSCIKVIPSSKKLLVLLPELAWKLLQNPGFSKIWPLSGDLRSRNRFGKILALGQVLCRIGIRVLGEIGAGTIVALRQEAYRHNSCWGIRVLGGIKYLDKKFF